MIKQKVCELVASLDREGKKWLMEYLENSDYFTAPASTKFHLAEEGGLVQHSWNVYSILKEKVKTYDLGEEIPVDSVIIAGLFHDLCKTDFYEKGGFPATQSQMRYLKSWYTPGTEISRVYASKLIKHFKGGGKENNMPAPSLEWSVNDKFPIGHGEKSVILLQHCINLTVPEMLAIRWHMGGFDPGVQFKYPSGFPFEKAQLEPLSVLLLTADYEAGFLVERRK